MAGLSAYSTLDRLLHRLAFASPRLQLVAADVEDALLGPRAGPEPGPPLFVTALPRAGTTVLLNAFDSLPHLATHRYRDMPFVMAPVLWARLSGAFRREATLAERAHGDGLTIGFDSPEAFEEVIWRAFWPRHYGAGSIRPWSAADRDAEGEAFLRAHIRKLVRLRCGGETEGGRYMSKNNGNIARLDLLRAVFPDAAIVVPFRDPFEHAASLLRQHRNFLALHEQDPFARRYMRDIGHLEFGALHTPIAFDGFEALAAGLDAGSADYWLAYWVAAYEHVLARADDLILVANEALRARGPEVLTRLCAAAGVAASPAELAAMAAHFRPGGRSRAWPGGDETLAARARELHRRLDRHAIFGEGEGGRAGV